MSDDCNNWYMLPVAIVLGVAVVAAAGYVAFGPRRRYEFEDSYETRLKQDLQSKERSDLEKKVQDN